MAKDFDDDDDRPRPPRKPPSVPSRSSRRDDDDDDDRPRSRKGEGDEPKKKSSLPIILGFILGILLICGGGTVAAIYLAFSGCKSWTKDLKKGFDESMDKIKKDEEERRAKLKQSEDNLKKIAIACGNYELTFGDFPTNSLDASGKGLLSWRVHILPYIEQDALYNKFKLNEPWDSPNNKPLIKQMPAIFAHDGDTVKADGRTYYRGFDGPGALFEKRFSPSHPIQPGGKLPPGVKILNGRIGTNQISDGLSNTILCVEARDSIEWTRPDELQFRKTNPLPSLGVDASQDYRIVMIDGKVKTINRFGGNDNAVKDAITIAGGEINTLPY